jgi:hypothetical protein
MWDRAGPISELWRIPDGKGESGLMSDSEPWGGSPCPCQLRINRLASVSKFDYVLMHTEFMGSHKLSSFDGQQVERSLTSPVVMYTRIVYVPSTDSPVHGITWKTCTRKRCDPIRLFDRYRELWPLVVLSWLTCVMLSGCYLASCKLIQILVKPLDMGDTCLLQSFHRSAISPMFIWDLWLCLMWLLGSRRMITKICWLRYRACLEVAFGPAGFNPMWAVNTL